MKVALAVVFLFLSMAFAGCGGPLDGAEQDDVEGRPRAAGDAHDDAPDDGSSQRRTGATMETRDASDIVEILLPINATVTFEEPPAVEECPDHLPGPGVLPPGASWQGSRELWSDFSLADAIQKIRDFIEKILEFSLIDTISDAIDKILDVIEFLQRDHEEAARQYVEGLKDDADKIRICYTEGDGPMVCEERLVDVGTTVRVDADRDPQTGVDGKDAIVTVEPVVREDGRAGYRLDVEPLGAADETFRGKIGVGLLFPDLDVAGITGFSAVEDPLGPTQSITLVGEHEESSGYFQASIEAALTREQAPAEVIAELVRIDPVTGDALDRIGSMHWEMTPAPRTAALDWRMGGPDTGGPDTTFAWEASESLATNRFTTKTYRDDTPRLVADLAGHGVPMVGRLELGTGPLLIRHASEGVTKNLTGTIVARNAEGTPIAGATVEVGDLNERFLLELGGDPFKARIVSSGDVDRVGVSSWFDRGGALRHNAGFLFDGIPRKAWLNVSRSDEPLTMSVGIGSIGSIDAFTLDNAWNVAGILDRKVWYKALEVPGAAWHNVTWDNGFRSSFENDRGLAFLGAHARFALLNETVVVFDESLTTPPRSLVVTSKVDPMDVSIVASAPFGEFDFLNAMYLQVGGTMYEAAFRVSGGPKELSLRRHADRMVATYDGEGTTHPTEFLAKMTVKSGTSFTTRLMIDGMPERATIEASADGVDMHYSALPGNDGVHVAVDIAIPSYGKFNSEVISRGFLQEMHFHGEWNNTFLTYRAPEGNDRVSVSTGVRYPFPQASTGGGNGSSQPSATQKWIARALNTQIPKEVAVTEEFIVEGGPVAVTIGTRNHRPYLDYQLDDGRDRIEFIYRSYLEDIPLFGGHLLLDGVPTKLGFSYGDNGASFSYTKNQHVDDLHLFAEYTYFGSPAFRASFLAEDVPIRSTWTIAYDPLVVAYQATDGTPRVNMQVDRWIEDTPTSVNMTLLEVPEAFSWTLDGERNTQDKWLTITSSTNGNSSLLRGIGRYRVGDPYIEVDLYKPPRWTEARLDLTRTEKTFTWKNAHDLGSTAALRYYSKFQTTPRTELLACDLGHGFEFHADRVDGKFLPHVWVLGTAGRTDLALFVERKAVNPAGAIEGHFDIVGHDLGILEPRGSLSTWGLRSTPPTGFLGMQLNGRIHESLSAQDRTSIAHGEHGRVSKVESEIDAGFSFTLDIRGIQVRANDVRSVIVEPGIVTEVSGDFGSFGIIGPEADLKITGHIYGSVYAEYQTGSGTEYPYGRVGDDLDLEWKARPIRWNVIQDGGNTIYTSPVKDGIKTTRPLKTCQAHMNILASPSVNDAAAATHIGTTKGGRWILVTGADDAYQDLMVTLSPKTDGTLTPRWYDNCPDGDGGRKLAAQKPISMNP